jgi:WD40 repeat protein
LGNVEDDRDDAATSGVLRRGGDDRFIAHLFGHSGRVLMLSFGPGPDQLMSAAADGTVRSWSLTEQCQLAEVRVDASLQCAAFSAESLSAIAASAAGVVAMSIQNQQATR